GSSRRASRARRRSGAAPVLPRPRNRRRAGRPRGAMARRTGHLSGGLQGYAAAPRRASKPDDDLAEELAFFHELEGGRSILEVEHAIDDRLDAMLGDERVQRFEMRARSDVDARDRSVERQERADGQAAREARQAADQRDVTAVAQ